MLSNHEQAHRYELKSTLIGHNNFEITYLPNDRVELSHVYDKKSTGKLVIPSFITDYALSPFAGCRYTEIILDNNEYNDIYINELFSKMRSLRLTIAISHPERIIDMHSTFMGCRNLEELHILSRNKNLKTYNLLELTESFYLCTSLKHLNLECIDTSKVIRMNSTFSMCSNLEHIDLSNFNTVNLRSMNSMFYGCKSLKSIDLSTLNTVNLESTDSMFMRCENICNIGLGEFGNHKILKANRMFRGCSSLNIKEPRFRRFGTLGYIG